MVVNRRCFSTGCRRAFHILFLSILVMVLVIACGPRSDAEDAPARPSAVVEVDEYSDLGTLEGDTLYRLTCDIVVDSGSVTVSASNVWIDLNGHDLTSTVSGSPVILVNSNGMLVIEDSAEDRNDYRQAKMVVNSGTRFITYSRDIASGMVVGSYEPGDTSESMFHLHREFTAVNGVVNINGRDMVLDNNQVTVDGTLLTFVDGKAVLDKYYDVTNGVAMVNGIGTAVYFGRITHDYSSTGILGRGIENNGTLYFNGGAVTDNCTNSGTKADDVGAAIHSMKSLVVDGGCITLNCSNKTDGGGINSGINSSSKASLDIAHCVITYNYCKNSGGGVMTQNGTDLLDTYINNNSCGDNGGGLYISRVNLSNHLYGSQIDCNTARGTGNGFGGGMFAGWLYAETCEFNYNYSYKAGGGICIDAQNTKQGIIDLYNCHVDHNISKNLGGGGVYAGRINVPTTAQTVAGKVTLRGSTTVDGNTASDGGGIRALFGVTVLEGSSVSISNNVSSSVGGGIHVGYYDSKISDSWGSSLIRDADICGNSSTGSGGGIYSECGLQMCSGTVGDNASGSTGGGIYTVSTTLSAGTVSGNTSSSSGGGIYCPGDLELANVDVLLNSAGTNGDKYVLPATPVREGYTFLGWFIEGVEETRVNNGDTVNLNRDTTIYAHWWKGGEEHIKVVTPSKDVVTFDSKVDPEKGMTIDIHAEDPDGNVLLDMNGVDAGPSKIPLHFNGGTGQDVHFDVRRANDIIEVYDVVDEWLSQKERIPDTILDVRPGNSATADPVALGMIADREFTLTVISETVSLSVDHKSLKGLSNQQDTIIIKAKVAESQYLTTEQRRTIGSGNAYSVTVESGGKLIHNFDGYITVEIPYAVPYGKYTLAVYCVNDDGTVENMRATYADGVATFKTSHLSVFFVKINTHIDRTVVLGNTVVAGMAIMSAIFAIYVGMLARRGEEL